MRFKSLLVSFLLILGITSPSYATSILFNTTDLGGGTWEYEYTVTNDTLLTDIEEFTVFFEYGLYDNLIVTTPLTPGWDELTANPVLIFGSPNDGFYDALALGLGIAPGNTASGFSVSFNWSGAGTPGSQPFDIVDTLTFLTIASGITTSSSGAPIPEPGTLMLLGSGITGITGLSFLRRRFCKRFFGKFRNCA